MPCVSMPVHLKPGRVLSAVSLACLMAVLIAASAGQGGGFNRARADLLTGAAASPAFSGSLAYVSGGDAWILLGAGSATRLTHSGDVTGVRWSPAGGWILVSRGRRQAALRSDGSQVLTISGAWSPDDADIAVPADDGGIDLVTPSNGPVRQLVPAQPNVAFRPVEWSPDGSVLALSMQTLGDTGLPVSESIWLVQRNGDALRELVSAGATWPRPAGWSPDGRWLAVFQGPAQLCVSCRADGEQLDVAAVDGSHTYTAGTVLRSDWFAWAPDSASIIAVVGAGRETYRDKHMVALDLATGAVTHFLGRPGEVETQPATAATGQLAFTRGPAVEGQPFTNLDATHGYPGDIAGRRIWLASLAGGADRLLDGNDGWAEESPHWIGAGTLLFVRWRDGALSGVPEAQLWLADMASGVTVEVVDSIDSPASSVGYYGEMGWSLLFAWHS